MDELTLICQMKDLLLCGSTSCRRELLEPHFWYCTTWCQKGYHSCYQERTKQTDDPRHSLYSHEPVNKRLKSRNSFVHLRACNHHQWSVPHIINAIVPSEYLDPGSKSPWLHLTCLNRLKNWIGPPLQIEHAAIEIQ